MATIDGAARSTARRRAASLASIIWSPRSASASSTFGGAARAEAPSVRRIANVSARMELPSLPLERRLETTRRTVLLLIRQYGAGRKDEGEKEALQLRDQGRWRIPVRLAARRIPTLPTPNSQLPAHSPILLRHGQEAAGSGRDPRGVPQPQSGARLRTHRKGRMRADV